jgi:ABC-type dipeptide/oligopeptide/nickel transport system permease subunit
MTDPTTPPSSEQTGLSDERDFELTEVAGMSQGQIVRRRFVRHKGAMLSLFLLAFIVVLAATSVGWGPIPGWYQWGPNQLVPVAASDSPTLSIRPTWLGGVGLQLGEHPFGVDNQRGRDMFALTMRGVQSTLVVIVILALLSTFIGVVIGAVAGYYGRWLDAVLMRFTDIVLVLPLLIVAAVAGFSLGLSGVLTVALLLGFFTWTGLARLVRAEFLALREREFVDAARVAGASSFRIIFRHILPNTVGVIVVSVTLLMGAGILTEAALGFLGFGIRSPDVSLGTLVNDYQGAFQSRPWLFTWPGIFIVAIVLCLQFIGDGLRDAYDPRQKRIPRRKDLDRPVVGPRTDQPEDSIEGARTGRAAGSILGSGR